MSKDITYAELHKAIKAGSLEDKIALCKKLGLFNIAPKSQADVDKAEEMMKYDDLDMLTHNLMDEIGKSDKVQIDSLDTNFIKLNHNTNQFTLTKFIDRPAGKASGSIGRSVITVGHINYIVSIRKEFVSFDDDEE